MRHRQVFLGFVLTTVVMGHTFRAQPQETPADGTAGLFQRGVREFEASNYDEAAQTFSDIGRGRPETPLIRTAREYSLRARLYSALRRGCIECPHHDAAMAARQLAALVDGPESLPWTRAIAQMAQASLLWRDNHAGQADDLMRQALTRWRDDVRGDTTPLSDIDRDVVGIWRTFFGPSEPGKFLLVSADLSVRLADGESGTVKMTGSMSGRDDVIPLEAARLDDLTTLVRVLSDRNYRENKRFRTLNPTSVEVFWARYFDTHGRPICCLEDVGAEPSVGTIRFIDAARTKASAPLRWWNQALTAILSKTDGRWTWTTQEGFHIY